jgi:hypothetical protein
MVFNPLNPDAPKQLADLVERVVQRVRKTVTNRAVKATNAVVFGLLASFAGLVALVLVLVATLRSVEAYFVWDPGTLGAWIVGITALVGVLITLFGLIRSKRFVALLGALLTTIGGVRWAIHAGDATIDRDTAVWLAYLASGGIFVLAGAFLMARRHAPEED